MTAIPQPTPPPPAKSPNTDSIQSQSEPKKITYDDLGISVQRPRRQDMASLAKRLQTFNDSWPAERVAQSKEVIADAGFYFAGQFTDVRSEINYATL